MKLFSFGRKEPSAPLFPADTLSARNGEPITLTFIKHAALAIDFGGRRIYVDPVSEYADYGRMPAADAVLVTHSHYDHFDRAAVEAVEKPGTLLVCDKTTAEGFDFDCVTMTPGTETLLFGTVRIEAVAAYNTTEGRTGFHPREREDCGYLLELGGTRIYIAGDTEPTPEMLALSGVDIAFLPVNQPYTMTVEQAAEAVRTLRPALFYPYHYGEVEEKTDLARLTELVGDAAEVRIRPME